MNRPPKTQFDLPGDLRRVSALSGKPRFVQLWEMLRLVLGPGKLSPWDYHYYRLWDDEALSWEQKREFIGNNSHGWIVNRVCDMADAQQLRDKVAAYRTLGQAGIPIPRTQAIYHPDREIEDVAALRSASEVAAFLRERMDYPFFFKPVTSLQSVGAGLARSLDRDSDQLRMQDGEAVPVEEFARRVENYCARQKAHGLVRPEAGYLFQDVAEQHPQVSALAGETLAGLRIYVMIDDRGPNIFAACWKIPAPGVAADNFYRPGALLADVNHETGEVGRIVRGLGLEREVFDSNPYTRRRLTGVHLPLFDELREVVLRGAALFPTTRYQGWDVGIGPDGPIVIEANHGSTFRLKQFASGRGLATPEFRDSLRRAEELNQPRPRLSPISWNRHESIWRLSGVWTLLRSIASRKTS